MRDMVELLASRFSLTDEERLEMLPSGQSKVFNNRVGWAKTHLKNAGLVDNPTRGRVRISAAGREALGRNPERIDMKFLRQFDGYRKFIGELKDEGADGTSGEQEQDESQSTPLELFETSFSTLRAALAEELLGRLIECSPQFFEQIVVKLLHAMGYGGQFGDPSEAAKLVWDVYYGNHQKKGPFTHLKVADIFMGGGTTVVEGSRLGMQMYGNDLNPVAWFVVKNELAQVDKEQVEALLSEIEAEVKPQIMPFFACDCPRGHKGKWTQVSTNLEMADEFDPLSLTPEQRKDYRYEGPEVIYTFWAKHGPCQVTGCGHRTPIMSTPVMAVKSISIKAWKRKCKHCGEHYDIEEKDARMAPGVELVVADSEHPFAIAKLNMVGNPESAVCPHCGKQDTFGKLPKPGKKAIELSLLVHPDWLKGESSIDNKGNAFGGSADDSVESTVRWNKVRAASCTLIEVRGALPDEVTLVDGTVIKTGEDGGTVPGKSTFACAACGTASDIREAIAASKTRLCPKTGICDQV